MVNRYLFQIFIAPSCEQGSLPCHVQYHSAKVNEVPTGGGRFRLCLPSNEPACADRVMLCDVVVADSANLQSYLFKIEFCDGCTPTRRELEPALLQHGRLLAERMA